MLSFSTDVKRQTNIGKEGGGKERDPSKYTLYANAYIYGPNAKNAISQFQLLLSVDYHHKCKFIGRQMISDLLLRLIHNLQELAG